MQGATGTGVICVGARLVCPRPDSSYGRDLKENSPVLPPLTHTYMKTPRTQRKSLISCDTSVGPRHSSDFPAVGPHQVILRVRRPQHSSDTSNSLL